MRDHLKKFLLVPSLALILLAGSIFPPADSLARESVPADSDIPYGAAADYLVGRQLLKEGQYAEALGFLHLVYRTHPDVPAVAVDFQEALVAEGYIKDALDVMNRLVASYPDSVAFLLQRSQLNLKLGHSSEALKDLQEIRNNGQANADVIGAEAKLLAAEGKFGQAMDVFRDGIHQLPDQGPQFYLGMAGLLQANEKAQDIPGLMGEALENYPDSAELHLVRIRALAALGEDEEALAAAQAADSHFRNLDLTSPMMDGMSPGDDGQMPPEALSSQVTDSFLVELADFYVQHGQVERGVGILEPLSEADELMLNPSLWLARIYLGTGQIEKGSALVQNLVERWPDSGRAWFLKAKLSEGIDDWAGAIPHFQKAVDKSPYDPELRVALVRALLVGWQEDLGASKPNAEQLSKRGTLEDHAVAALTLVPNEDAEGQLVLGYAFRSLDDPWRAESCFGLAAEKPGLKINAMTQRSLCFDEMGDPVKARQVLEELHLAFPEDPEVANSLGYFLAEKGLDLEKAEELIKIALADQPGNGAFLDSMGWVLFRQGRTETAFDFMIQAVNVLPDDPVILEHLGMVMLNLGQTDEAAGMLRRALALGGDKARLEAVLSDIESGQEKPSSNGNPNQGPERQ